MKTADPTSASGFRVRVPRATYRLQFHAGFTLRDATEWAPYLAKLGVSDVYASPLAQPRAGSMHGYDVCDPNRLNPELGTEADFERFSAALQAHGLGLLLDIVPNHMGVGERTNAWWWEVLEQGRASVFAEAFDIDWDPPRPGLRGKVLLPVLGTPYGEALERGELRIVNEGHGPEVAYFDQRYPLSPATWASLLEEVQTAAGAGAGSASWRAELGVRLTEAEELLGGSGAGEARRTAWQRWKQDMVAALAPEGGLRTALAARLREVNGHPGNAANYDRLDGLLRQQHYVLAWWRLGTEHLNYRRFFDIPHLWGLRVEVPEVFLRSHEWVARLWHEGRLSGLRIDHPDGLWNPAGYLRRLQRLAREAAPEGAQSGQTDGRGRALYVVVEKILSPQEPLPDDWPVHGTTGYDFLNLVNGVLVDPGQAESLTRIYHSFIRRSPVFADEVHRNKRSILDRSFRPEWESLIGRLERLLAGTRKAGDYGRSQLREAVAELVSAFPVYRSYAEPDTVCLTGFQQGCVDAAVRAAARRNPRAPAGLYLILGRLLSLQWPRMEDPHMAEAREWVMRFQQLTGPAMAKGLEDTTFYTFNRLISLNEVGGHPDHFGLSIGEFHQANRERAVHWPATMLATATHDTKRGEDLRARIHVLAELAEEWERTLVQAWALNAPHKREVQGSPAPSANDELLLYQTLVGLGLPGDDDAGGAGFRERVEAYGLKAIREAKTHTAWVDGDPEYEAALTHFIRAILDPAQAGAFLEVLGRLARRAAWFGRFNSLTQTLLKLTAPGVPDLYQGTEFLDLALVDPDNRRPVDFNLRQTALAELEAVASRAPHERTAAVRGLVETGDGSRAKLWVIWQTLGLRQTQPGWWTDGAYVPLPAVGHWSDHVLAFARGAGAGDGCLVVTTRLPVGLTGGAEHLPLGAGVWGDTSLSLPEEWQGAEWENRLTGERVRPQRELLVAEALRSFPVALLAPPASTSSQP